LTEVAVAEEGNGEKAEEEEEAEKPESGATNLF
jgi:hypothetical protein